jgi:hypothetical protein
VRCKPSARALLMAVLGRFVVQRHVTLFCLALQRVQNKSHDHGLMKHYRRYASLCEAATPPPSPTRYVTCSHCCSEGRDK